MSEYYLRIRPAGGISKPLFIIAAVLAGILGLFSSAESGYSVLDKDFRFKCSPSEQIGCEGVFPVKPAAGSRFALVPSGEDAFALRIQSIRQAKKSIRIQSFIFRGDEAGLFIAQNLIKRKTEDDLDIKVIVDAYFNPGAQTQDIYYDLKLHGIEVEGYEAGPLEWLNEIDLLDWYRGNKRFHDKMWIIDGETSEGLAFVGGINIANEYFRVGPEAENKWRDQDIALKGDIVSDITAAFDRNYAYLKRQKTLKTPLLNTDNYWSMWRQLIDIDGDGQYPALFKTWGYSLDIEKMCILSRFAEREVPLNFAPARSRFVQSRPRCKETYITQAYLDMIRSAEKEIIIVNAYFIPSADIIQALQEAVTQRNVAVTILTNSAATNNHGNAQIVARSLYHNLLRINSPKTPGSIAIHEWRGDLHGEGTLHAKFAVFDCRALVVGAYNLDPRGHSLNSETVIVLESPVLAKSLRHRVFEKDLPKTQQITREQAKRFQQPPRLLKSLKLKLATLFKSQL
ncbi:MAG: phosphatidylserine/phosphatidylglycerophosphate/cardiolipin synthase family protein [Desulfosudaceae bacterium]